MKLYALIVLVLMAPAFIAIAMGVEPGLAVTASIVLTFVAAGVSLIDLYRLYLSTPQPRSQFFRMLLDANTLKVVVFGWFAYLIAAVILERYEVLSLPIPDPEIRSVINGVVTVVFLASTVYYAQRTRRIVKELVTRDLLHVEVITMPNDGSNGEPLPPDS